MKFYKIDVLGDKALSNMAEQMASASSEPTRSEQANLDRVIWGNADDGSDIMDTMFVNGSIYLNPGTYSGAGFESDDDDDYDDDDDDSDVGFTDAEDRVDLENFKTRSGDEGGNIYTDGGIYCGKVDAKEEVFGRQLFLNYPTAAGNKTNLIDILNYLVPVGTILPWTGNSSEIPKLNAAGWFVCNGENGTPDLRGKFLYGADMPGGTGGNSSVTLSTSNLPSHSHTATTTVNLEITNNPQTTPDEIGVKNIAAYDEVLLSNVRSGTGNENWVVTNYDSHGEDMGFKSVNIYDLVGYSGTVTGTATATTTVGNTGNGQSFSILPPFYTVVYIMKRN